MTIPVGSGEKGPRWCRCNPPIASLSTAAALVLLAGVPAGNCQTVRAAGVEQSASAEADRAKVAKTLHDRGSDAARQGNLKDAEALFSQALEISQKGFAKNDPEIAASLDDLAGAKVALG